MRSFLVKSLEYQKQSIQCSLNDHFVSRMPVPVVFFYHKAIKLDLIIEALQKVLPDYPIFAGTIVKRSHQLYIECNNQGVQFKVTHSTGSLFKILCNINSLNNASFVDLINPRHTLKKQTPVLTIKISYYSDGMAIGYCWHHSIGDMSTFMEFLKAISACAQGKNHQKALIVKDREDYLNQWIINQIHPEKECLVSGLRYLNFKDIFNFLKHIVLPKRSIYFYFTKDEVSNLRDALTDKSGQKLSRNDAISAHLLSLLAICRNDNSTTHNASIVVNIRPRLGMLASVPGNYLGAASLSFLKSSNPEMIAESINSSVKNFLQNSFRPYETRKFIQKCGGLKKLNRIIPEALLPQNKNLIITNWSNFGVYSIDFGICTPYLFLPIGEARIPWVSCIVEGFNNEGLLISIALPSKVARQFEHPSMQKLIHAYRKSDSLKVSVPTGVL